MTTTGCALNPGKSSIACGLGSLTWHFYDQYAKLESLAIAKAHKNQLLS